MINLIIDHYSIFQYQFLLITERIHKYVQFFADKIFISLKKVSADTTQIKKSIV